MSNTDGIAIIGMSGKFSGCRNIEEFWKNLCEGKELISSFTDKEMKENCPNPKFIKNSNYVNASGVLEDIDMFDASFFGFNPLEAQLMDPQQRLFLECAWEALENAGYNTNEYNGTVGVFAGSEMSTYIFNLLSDTELIDSIGNLQAQIGNDKDFIPTRVSYKLNLTGPSVNIQTACSTSLVSIHTASQSLLNGECDMALAGGVNIRVPHKIGYLYQDGGIMSPDGHCRAFDENAKGTVVGNGLGIVVLKRLDEALEDGDHIYAVIKGSAINNDGSEKIGYTAPSVLGQAKVISEAISLAGVETDEISYIETHGTATPLGDTIEIEALRKVFESDENDYRNNKFCALGSVKTNVGHLSAAAGVTGFIKTALALKNRMIPPSLNFSKPNPKIDLENSPFYVNTQLKAWERKNAPLVAGVSSFGIGGTNAHVVLEEAPQVNSSDSLKPCHLIVLSAKSNTALNYMTENMIEYLKKNPDGNLADIAYTCQVGRQEFKYRKMAVCKDINDAVAKLKDNSNAVVQENFAINSAFIFPASDSYYLSMGHDLYRNEAVFKDEVDLCAKILRQINKTDIIAAMFPESDNIVTSEVTQNQTCSQLSTFILEYASAKLYINYGVQPKAMLGYGVGELAAACIAGVIKLEASLKLIISSTKDSSKLTASSSESLELNKPAIPFISCATGDWITDAAATSPGYWLNILEQINPSPEGFDKLSEKAHVLLEIGPGNLLSLEEDSMTSKTSNKLILKAFKGASILSEQEHLMDTLGKLWLNGIKIDWKNYYSGEKRLRTVLPTYPFERQSYWIERKATAGILPEKQDQSLYKNKNIEDWFYVPSWKKEALVEKNSEAKATDPKCWLLFIDDEGIGKALQRRLMSEGKDTVTVQCHTVYSKNNENEYLLNPEKSEDYINCIESIIKIGKSPDVIVHMWNIYSQNSTGETTFDSFKHAQNMGFYSLLHICKALSKNKHIKNTDLWVINNNLYEVESNDNISPEKSTITGLCKVIPQEYTHISCKCLDIKIDALDEIKTARIAKQLSKEFQQNADYSILSIRGNNRWIQTFEQVRLCKDEDKSELIKDEGIYIITGGLGNIGMEIARHLALKYKAKIMLTSRSKFPGRADWENWLSTHSTDNEVSIKIRAIRDMEASGAEIIIESANVCSISEMENAVTKLLERFGKINGVFHGAGITHPSTINELKAEDCERYFEAKAYGLIALEKVLRNVDIDFCLLLSSISSIFGGLGFAAYSASNIFMDSFADMIKHTGTIKWLNVNWDSWNFSNEASSTKEFGSELSSLSITPDEGMIVLDTVLSTVGLTQFIVSTGNLNLRYNKWIKLDSIKKFDKTSQVSALHERPKMDIDYIEPRNDTEKIVAQTWSELLGINKIGIKDNFFDLGGHSLIALQIIARLKKIFSVELPMEDMFDEPTVENTATIIGVLKNELIGETI